MEMKVKLNAQVADWCMAVQWMIRSGYSVMNVKHGGTWHVLVLMKKTLLVLPLSVPTVYNLFVSK